MSCNIHVLKSTNEETNGLKRKNQYAIVPRFSSVSVSVPVNTETAQTSESSSWGQQTGKCPCCTKWNVPLTLGPVRGRHCTPSLSLTVHELVCCEQWGCNPISVGSLGRPVCERAGRQRPSLLTEAPVSDWTTDWPAQMDSDEERSGWFSDTDVWAQWPRLFYWSYVISKLYSHKDQSHTSFFSLLSALYAIGDAYATFYGMNKVIRPEGIIAQQQLIQKKHKRLQDKGAFVLIPSPESILIMMRLTMWSWNPCKEINCSHIYKKGFSYRTAAWTWSRVIISESSAWLTTTDFTYRPDVLQFKDRLPTHHLTDQKHGGGKNIYTVFFAL